MMACLPPMQTMKRLALCAALCALTGTSSARAQGEAEPKAPATSPAPTPAERSAGEWVERLRDAVTRHRLSLALREGRQASAAYPDDPAILYWYGTALARTLQPTDAMRVLERALAIAPTDRTIAAALLDTYWNFGHLDRARILAPAARQDFPEDRDIAFIAGLLDLEARLRERRPLPLPESGPEHTAALFTDAIARGDLAQAVERYVSRPHLYQWTARFLPDLDPADDTPATRDRVLRFVAGMARGAAQSTFHDKVPLGCEIQPGATIGPDDTTVVTGYLLAKGHLTEKQVAFLHAAEKQPELSQAVDAELLRTFIGLEPADRDAFARRLLRTDTLTYWTVHLKMRRTPEGPWKVHDLGLDGTFWLSDMNTLARPAQDSDPATAPGDPAPPDAPARAKTWTRTAGPWIGGLVAIIAIIGLIITVSRRKQRSP